MDNQQSAQPPPLLCTRCGKENRPTSKFCAYCGAKIELGLALAFTPADLDDLKAAKLRLEYPSLTAKVSDLIGKPIEAGLERLPPDWQEKVGDVTRAALFKGLDYAIRTMGKPEPKESQDRLHQMLVAGTGALSGAAGLWAVAVELPVSTCLMLRSIADIARSEGHDISKLDIRLACLEVFALGSKSATDDASESGYWAVRLGLAAALPEAVAYIAKRGVIEESAPPVARFVAIIASRFSIVVTEETAAKAVPVVGAVSGGLINLLFMNHFQEMARGHFTIKRLEAKYGSELVQQKYKECVV
jgi:hypothetical protein